MPFSLYIHWPFCLKKCPYCDFNSYAWKYDEKEWINALIKEISLYKNIFIGYKIQTIFFGGGTPSLISPNSIQKILSVIHNTWNTNPSIETTIEVNPSSIETNNLEDFLNNGINRFSIGMQSLNDEDLKFLGRLHSAEEAKKIVQYAAKICDKVSVDFIYTLPYDDLPKWKKELNNIIEFLIQNNLKHVSLYQLTIENNTAFANDVKNKKWLPMNQDNQSILYRHTHKIFNQIHWNQYEISNIAKYKDEESKHNLGYWRYQEYLGIGPGAHSRMINNHEKYKFNNHKSPHKWKRLLEATNNTKTIEDILCLEECQKLSKQDQLIEKLLMGLRLSEGVKLKPEELNFINLRNLDLLIKKNFIRKQQERITLSLNGRLKLNAILAMLIK